MPKEHLDDADLFDSTQRESFKDQCKMHEPKTKDEFDDT